MDFLLGICYFNGANNWQWNNSKWNYDSSFLVLVGHLYGFSRKCCQLLQSVVALKTAAPTRSSRSGLGSQRWQAGLTRYITSSYISTHDASLFLWELSHHHDMKLFKRNTTQSRSREGLRLWASGMHRRPTSEEQEHERGQHNRFGRWYLMWPKGTGCFFSMNLT